MPESCPETIREKHYSRPLPFEMPEIIEPKFPDRSFDIRQYGAAFENVAATTTAIAEAIAACHKSGGGRVVVPAGEWRTGPIHLKSNVDLHLVEGAILHFSDRFEDYYIKNNLVLVMRGGVEALSYSPLIYARNCQNIAVTGRGTLNGNGRAWWDEVKPHERGGVLQTLFDLSAKGVPVTERSFPRPSYGLRPAFIQPIDCENVLLEGFTLRDGPAWNLNPVRCENLTIRGITLISPDGPNNDGIDPEMCRNVLIEDCFLDTADDCIALKAGRDEEGWRYGRPCENIIIRRVRTARGLAGVAIGSEISGGIRNVFIHDCVFEGTRGGIRIKTQPGRGGFIEDIYVQNILMSDIKWDAILVTVAYGRGYQSASRTFTAVRRLNFTNIRCEGAATAIAIIGAADNPIRDLLFRDIEIESEAGSRFTHAESIGLCNVCIDESVSPAFSFTNVDGARLEGRITGKRSPFLQIHGNIGRGFSFSAGDEDMSLSE